MSFALEFVIYEAKSGDKFIDFSSVFPSLY